MFGTSRIRLVMIFDLVPLAGVFRAVSDAERWINDALDSRRL
jgi:hypothetical protein